jgi:hypothetical protein
MKTASQIARYLLGLILLVFGFNGFFNFLHIPGLTALQAKPSSGSELNGFEHTSMRCDVMRFERQIRRTKQRYWNGLNGLNGKQIGSTR